MQLTNISKVILGLLLFSGILLNGGGATFASDVDELRERANAIRKKAAILAEQGNKELAVRLEKESMELFEAAERQEAQSKKGPDARAPQGIDLEVKRHKERLRDLNVQLQKMQDGRAPQMEINEIRDQISKTERGLQKIHASQGVHRPEFQARVEKLENANRRLHHLRVAAENLKMAEEHDMAHKLMLKGDEIERDVHAAKQQLALEMRSEGGRNNEMRPDIVGELKEEIERLRAEVRELKGRMERR